MRLNLKLIGILFIALYCLVPLCAADLNQSNIADDNGINGENSNIELAKVTNETKNKENNNLKADYYFPLEVHVNDVKKGEKIVVEITTEDYISASVKYFIFGPTPYSQYDHLFLEHGYGSFEIDSSDLPAGDYRVKVCPDNHNMDGEAYTTFTVYP